MSELQPPLTWILQNSFSPLRWCVPNPPILLDMDEVLADFVGGALKAHGWTPERLVAVCPPGACWSIGESMGLTQEQFWLGVDSLKESFWGELAPLPWMEEVLSWVKSEVGESWYVVSSPPRASWAWSGKVKWLQRYLGRTFDRIVLTSHKHLLARPGSVLIDDSPHNVERFRAAGGSAILFPCDRNENHVFSARRIEYLAREYAAVVGGR